MKAGVEGSVGSRGAAEPVKGAQLELTAAYAVCAKMIARSKDWVWLGLAWDENKRKDWMVFRTNFDGYDSLTYGRLSCRVR